MEAKLGSYEATQYLIDRGHTKICHIGTSAESPTGRERRTGFERAMRDASLTVETGMIEYGHWTVQGGYEAMLRLLAKRQEMTALFAGNDLLAFGAMRALHEVGRRVPENVSIIGFDGWQLSEHTTPALTTMHVDRGRVGVLAAQAVMRRLRSPEEPGQCVRVPATLIERASVARIGVPSVSSPVPSD